MNLVSWAFTCNTPRSGGFPSLKILHVSVNDPQDDQMQKLFSCCPVLECLVLDGTIEGDNTGVNFNFVISAPELKTLRISLENVYHFLDVSVDAPKLENFILRQLGLTKIAFLGNAKSLVNAAIAFRRHFKIDRGLDVSNFAVTLLDQLSNVRSLHISAHCLENLHLPKDFRLPTFHNVNQLRLAFGDHSCWKLLVAFVESAPNLENLYLEYATSVSIPNDVHIPALHNVKQLRLAFWDHRCWELLGNFLHSAPNLEDLWLEDRNKVDNLLENQWNPPEDVPVCLESHLKSLFFLRYKPSPFQIQMMDYLHKNSPQLNRKN